MGRLLEAVHHRALEGALRLSQALPVSDPPLRELPVDGGQAERFDARALAEGRESVLQEEADDAVGVERIVRHSLLPAHRSMANVPGAW